MKRVGIVTVAFMLALAPVSHAFAQAGTTVSNGTVYNDQGRIVGTVGPDGVVTSGGIPIGYIIGGVFVAGALTLGFFEIAGGNSDSGCTTVFVSGVSRCQ